MNFDWLFLSVLTSVISFMSIRWGLVFLGEPIVFGLICGWFFRDLATGLYLGAVIQFMWLTSVPVGVKVQSNYTVMTLLSLMLVFRYGRHVFPLAFGLGYFFAMVLRAFEMFTRKLNNSMADAMIRKLDKNNNWVLIHFGYISAYIFILSILVYLSIVISNYILFRGLPFVPLSILAAFRSAWDYLPFYGLSLFLPALSYNLKILYVLAGVVIAIVINFFQSDSDLTLFLLVIFSFVIPLIIEIYSFFKQRKDFYA